MSRLRPWIVQPPFYHKCQAELFRWEGDLDNPPPNLLTMPWLPQQDVLAHQNLKVFQDSTKIQNRILTSRLQQNKKHSKGDADTWGPWQCGGGHPTRGNNECFHVFPALFWHYFGQLISSAEESQNPIFTPQKANVNLLSKIWNTVRSNEKGVKGCLKLFKKSSLLVGDGFPEQYPFATS